MDKINYLTVLYQLVSYNQFHNMEKIIKDLDGKMENVHVPQSKLNNHYTSQKIYDLIEKKSVKEHRPRIKMIHSSTRASNPEVLARNICYEGQTIKRHIFDLGYR